MFKEQKGITLVALVITIIVLLILAGVSIAMLTGDNGIFNKATTAKDETGKASVTEAVSLAISEIMANKVDPTYKDSDNELNTTTISKLAIQNDTSLSKGTGKDTDVDNTHTLYLKTASTEYKVVYTEKSGDTPSSLSVEEYTATPAE